MMIGDFWVEFWIISENCVVKMRFWWNFPSRFSFWKKSNWLPHFFWMYKQVYFYDSSNLLWPKVRNKKRFHHQALFNTEAWRNCACWVQFRRKLDSGGQRWCFWRPWVVVICFKTYILVTSILTNLPFLPPWVTWAWRSKKLVQPWWFCLP